MYLSENWWVSLDKIAPEHERMRDFLEKLAKIIKQDLDQYGIVADDLESVRNIFANEPFLCELRDYLTTV